MSFREWKFIKLGEIGTIITGKTPSTKNEDNFGNKYPFITPRDMDGQKRIVDFTERYLSQQGLESVSKQVLDGISICVSCIGSDMGKVILARTKCVTNQQINSITSIKEDYDPFFIYYSLKPLKEYFHKIAGGSTMPIINKSKFSQIEILVPPLKEQKAIAHILSTLDEKIELNNKINKTLEDIAQAIFKHWFVDFEFPNEDGEPYKSSGGEMVESELGMIPKGWEVKSLDQIADFLNGLAMQKYRPKDGEQGIPVIKIKELRQGFTDNSSDLCSKEIDPKYIVNDGDIIFSWSGSLLVDLWCGGKCGLNQHLFKVSSKEYPRWFYYHWIKLHLDRFINIAKSKATTMGHIKRQDLSDSLVVIPDESLFGKANSVLSPLVEKQVELKIESRKLSELRNTLLPKLMSGEIRVPLDQEGDCEEVS